MTTGLAIKIVGVLTAVIVGAGVALVLPLGAQEETTDGPARAWIDNPLDGAVVPPGPVEVVAHAYDPSLVSSLTLRIDGEPLEEIVFDEPGTLQHATWAWTPETEGVYTLMATGTNPDGAPGLTAVAVVTVGGGTSPRTVVEGTLVIPWLTVPEPSTTTTLPEGTTTVPAPTSTSTTTPATTSTTRPRPTTTSAPTTTTTTAPCTPMTPVLAYPPDGATFNQTQQVELGWIGWIFGVSCFPSGFYAEVTTSPGAAPIRTQHFPADQATWTIPAGNLACGQTYHWRVFSKRSDGTLTDASIYRSFDVICVPH